MIQSLGRSQDRPLREPFRIIEHTVVLAITSFIFRPEKSGALPNRHQSAMSEHNTPGPVGRGPLPMGLLQTKQQTHRACSGKLLLPEAALNEPSLLPKGEKAKGIRVRRVKLRKAKAEAQLPLGNKHLLLLLLSKRGGYL